MSNYQVKDNHIAAEYDVNGNVITQDEVNERVKSDIKWLKENGTALSPEQVTNLAKVPVLASQLDETNTKIVSKTYSRHMNSTRNIVSFYMDDAPIEDYTIIKPIAEAKGIPMTIGVISALVGSGGQMTLPQILELQAKGWEMQDHLTRTLDLRTMNEAEQDLEFRTSQEHFKRLGIKNVESVMYPQGYYNATTMKVARKYYRSGLSSDLANNKSPIRTYNVYRCLMDDKTLDQLKARVDSMSNNWVIFYSHSAGWGQEMIDKFSALIDYVKSKNIEITTCSKALDVFENRLDIGDSNDKYYRIGADGTIDSKPLGGFNFGGLYNGVNNATPLSNFEKWKVTSNSFIASDSSGIPYNNGVGTLLTFRIHDEDTCAYQEFQPQNSVDKFYRRRWTGSAWSAWTEFRKDRIISFGYQDLNMGSIPANGSNIVDLTINGLLTNQLVLMSIMGEVPTGITYTYSVSSANILKVKIYNNTASAINVGNRGIYVTQINHS